MKKIISHTREYIQQYFHFKLYLATALVLIVGVFLNYYFDFEDSVIDSYRGENIRILWFFLVQGIPYYIVCMLVAYFTPYRSFLYQKSFWLVSIFGFFVLGFERAFYYHTSWALKLDHNVMLFAHKVVGDCFDIITIILPLGLYYYCFERKSMNGFYGLTTKVSDVRPYVVLLLLSFLFIFPASFLSDFQAQYPQYNKVDGADAALYWGMSEGWIALIYESVYALTFVTVELFFRGFLILVFVRYLGPYVVLPMVVTYVFLHFGKPLGETISSAFGGYVLGILAYRTKNIWGGVILHMGVALLMELAAYWQKFF